jgi:hypothetical protein
MTRSRETNTVVHEHLKVGLTELAIGERRGPSRDALLRHIASCADCAAELAHLEELVHGLLLLAPEIDPPVGFEERLLGCVRARGLVPTRGPTAAAESNRPPVPYKN